MSEDELAVAENAVVRKVVQISTMVEAAKDWASYRPEAMMDHCGFIAAHGRRIESIPQTVYA